MPYQARTAESLLQSLERMFQGRSRKDLRRLLAEERVLVNGDVVTDGKAAVKAGDSVDCVSFGKPQSLHPRVRLLFEDDHLLGVEKGVGILTSDGVIGRDLTVVDVLERYLRRRGLRRRVFACHRLDRDVSGVCLFAKDPRVAARVRDNTRQHLKERVYHAVVEGVPSASSGTIKSYLKDDDVTKVVREVSPEDGKLCITHYQVLESRNGFAALEVRLETGRKNQIRAQLASIGHPIAGDSKYGARTDPAGRIALHARLLRVAHPVTGEPLELCAEVPVEFGRALTRRPERRGAGSRSGRDT